MRRPNPRRGFDEAWKYAMRAFFREGLQLLFPAVHDAIDWEHPVEFVETEFYRLAPGARSQRRQSADVVAKVRFLDGAERFVFIHIEIQAQHDPNFPRRMFVYHYHIYDAYDYPEVVSLAILADANPRWRPSSFGYENVGSSLQFRFTSVKLLDFDEQSLEQLDNPFALVVQAHLRALKARGEPNLVFSEKVALIRKLRERGYTQEQIVHLYKVVDYLMTLSPELEKLVRQVVRKFQREREWPLTSLEEIAIEEGARKGVQQGFQQGIQQGIQQGLQQGRREGIVQAALKTLQRRFGDAALELQPRLMQVESENRLLELSLLATEVSSLDEFVRALEAEASPSE